MQRISAETQDVSSCGAGADRVMREMASIFKDDPHLAEPIDNAINAVFAKIYSELG